MATRKTDPTSVLNRRAEEGSTDSLDQEAAGSLMQIRTARAEGKLAFPAAARASLPVTGSAGELSEQSRAHWRDR